MLALIDALCLLLLSAGATAAPATRACSPDPAELCRVHDFDTCALQPAVRHYCPVLCKLCSDSSRPVAPLKVPPAASTRSSSTAAAPAPSLSTGNDGSKRMNRGRSSSSSSSSSGRVNSGVRDGGGSSAPLSAAAATVKAANVCKDVFGRVKKDKWCLCKVGYKCKGLDCVDKVVRGKDKSGFPLTCGLKCTCSLEAASDGNQQVVGTEAGAGEAHGPDGPSVAKIVDANQAAVQERQGPTKAPTTMASVQ
eukprot:gene9962-15782_t